jgi:hypothetical protein
MLHNIIQLGVTMDGLAIEIFICEDCDSVLIPALSELQELVSEIGQYEFDFTPYCG